MKGLTLLPWDSATGYKGVSAKGTRFRAYNFQGGNGQYLGSFSSAVEAAPQE